MNPNEIIYEGTIVRMMNERPYRVLEDTTAHSRALMIPVNEDFSEIPEKKECHCILLLDEILGEGLDRQSILYRPSIKYVSRFELMDL